VSEVLSAVFASGTGIFRSAGRDIIGRIVIKESVGFEQETDVCSGHDGIVFASWNMRVPKGIPENDIFVFDGAISGSPSS